LRALSNQLARHESGVRLRHTDSRFPAPRCFPPNFEAGRSTSLSKPRAYGIARPLLRQDRIPSVLRFFQFHHPNVACGFGVFVDDLIAARKMVAKDALKTVWRPPIFFRVSISTTEKTS